MRVYGTHVIRLIHHYASECIISQLRASILAAIYHGQVEITRVFERMTKKNPKSSALWTSTFESIHMETVWCKKLKIKLELNTMLFKTWGTAAPKSCSLYNSSFYTSSSIVMCSERQMYIWLLPGAFSGPPPFHTSPAPICRWIVTGGCILAKDQEMKLPSRVFKRDKSGAFVSAR